MAGFNESTTVQQPILDLLVSLGWEHVHGNDLDRNHEDVFVESDLTAALGRLNPAVAEDPARAAEVLAPLRAIVLAARDDGLVVANQRFVPWLRGQQTHRFQGRDGYEPVRLVAYAGLAVNRLVVSDEVWMGTPGHECRFDLVLWVNGIPLVVIETKSRTSTGKKLSWLDGAKDIHDVYEPGWPEFFVPNAFTVATEGKELRYAGVCTNLESWGVWGTTTDPVAAPGWARVKRAIELLLTPAMVVSIVNDYTAFELKGRHSGAPTLVKIVPRYPQVEAVSAIVARALHGTKRQGLIHHTQGSGKTLAMLFAAVRLINEPVLANPSIIMIADRVQLVTQMYQQFARAGMPTIEAPETAQALRAALAADKRGVFFSTVHKFRGAGVLNERSNVVVLIDEAHRTQEGQLGAHLRAAFPNARFFGFTGTPIADADRNTFELYGDPDDPGHVMNTYDSDRSIADGTTVPMHVSPRLVNFHIRRAELDAAFEELASEEGLNEDERDIVAARATSTRTLFANPERIRTVCRDIIEHFYATVEPLGMKAQVVVFDRGLCVAYQQELTRLLAERAGDAVPDESALVMSVSTKDDPDWQQYRLTDAAEEQMLGRFRAFGDRLKFLVVTSKLGTGFDAPIEGVMYLDKPLKLHTLFQTITRTNRNWKNPATGQEKLYGLIVDYVGLGDGFARAMSPADPETARKELDTATLVVQFEAELDTALDRFAGIDRTSSSFDSLQAAHERIPDTAAQDRFAVQFGIVQGIWEALWPEEALEAHVEDYRWLSKVYASVMPSDTSRELLWHRLGAKTMQLVHGHIGEVTVNQPGVDVVIADEGTIARLVAAGIVDPDEQEQIQSGAQTLTAAEVLESITARLKRRLEGGNGTHAVYQSLAARLEKLRERQFTRAQESISFLQEMLDVATDLTTAEKVEDETGREGLDLIPDLHIGALTQIFNEYKPADTPVILEKVVTDIDQIVTEVKYPGWVSTKRGDRLVRTSIMKVLGQYRLPVQGELFDRAYAYIAANY